MEKTLYKVNLNGEVIIEAASEADALTKSREYFVTTGKGLVWAVQTVKVELNAVP